MLVGGGGGRGQINDLPAYSKAHTGHVGIPTNRSSERCWPRAALDAKVDMIDTFPCREQEARVDVGNIHTIGSLEAASVSMCVHIRWENEGCRRESCWFAVSKGTRKECVGHTCGP